MRHHNNTGSVDHDEVFIPKKKKEIVAVAAGGWGVTKYLQHPLGRILMIALILLLGWPFYLICNISGRKYPRRIYVGFVVDIDIKILGGGFLLHSCLLVSYFFWKYFHKHHHNNTVPIIGKAM
jgi:fatty acid desaturase